MAQCTGLRTERFAEESSKVSSNIAMATVSWRRFPQNSLTSVTGLTPGAGGRLSLGAGGLPFQRARRSRLFRHSALIRSSRLPEQHHRTRDCKGGIGADNDANHQDQGETVDNFTAEQIEGQNRQESQPGGQNRPAQGLVYTAVHQILEILAPV